MDATDVVELDDVSKTYEGQDTRALNQVKLLIRSGEFVAIMGPSGCGKSTLLNILGGIDRPSEGTVVVTGQRLNNASEEQLTSIRRSKIGFVFQFFNLLNTLTVYENIALPLELKNTNPKIVKERVSMILERVGMSQRARFYPAQLSGGEMQRTAIARALVHQPSILLADEPTGNLDSVNGNSVLGLLKSLSNEGLQTIVMATHSVQAAQYATRVIQMKDGHIVEDSQPCR